MFDFDRAGHRSPKVWKLAPMKGPDGASLEVAPAKKPPAPEAKSAQADEKEAGDAKSRAKAVAIMEANEMVNWKMDDLCSFRDCRELFSQNVAIDSANL